MTFREIADSQFALPCDLALLAMGFVGAERPGMLEALGVKFTERGNVWRDANWMTSVPGVFTAGDMQRGQSLIVWAIAEGRSCARGVDRFLMGSSDLPAPLP
jgi:glutamate synthase (NADPH/NADH) small chain